MTKSWRKSLYDLLCDSFAAEDLSRLVRHYDTGVPKSALRDPRAGIRSVADDLVVAAGQHGVRHGLFDALIEERPGRREEFEEIRELWRSSQGSPEPLGPSRANAVSVGVPNAAIVLDRLAAWGSILDRCGESDENLIIVVHGDHEQDVDLFMERIRVHLTSEVIRRHRLYWIPRSTEEEPAVSGGDWSVRIADSVPVGNDLVGTLYLSAQRQAALYLFHDYNNPLKDMLWKKGFDGLVELFRAHVGPALAKSPPKHRLRFILPFQHNGKNSKRMRACIIKLEEELAKIPGFEVILLKELEIPNLEEFLKQVEKDEAEIFEAIRPDLIALHEEFTDHTRTPEPTILGLGTRLQKLIDDETGRRLRSAD